MLSFQSMDSEGVRAEGQGRFAGKPGAWTAAAVYSFLSLGLTWPLPLGLARDIPADLGDPVLNCWIIAWGAEHLRRFVSGDLAAFVGFWDANIFHPAPLTLTYSEHLFAQAVQVAPLYALTQELVLCYNVLFLSTFVLSGLGLFLLLRDITGDAGAAFAGGLVFAFAPYRFEHAAHLQLLSLQWLPLAMLGFRRFARTGRLLPLALGAAALVAHGLSCGYYLLFFFPFVASYVVYELGAARRLSSGWRWLGFALAAVATVSATLPFLLPYLRARGELSTVRSVATLRLFSADLSGWVTATPESRLWGPLLAGLDQAEAHLFPGVVPSLLAFVAVAGAFGGSSGCPRRPRRAAAALLVSVAFGVLLAHWLPQAPPPAGLILRVAGFTATPMGLLQFAVGALAAGAVVSTDVRRLVARAFSSFTGFCAASCVLGVWLSLGVEPRLWGLALGVPAPYTMLYEYVPGFDGLRSPARYAAVTVFFLSLLAGIGAGRLRRLRSGHTVTTVLLLAFLVECACVPLPLNRGWGAPGLRPPPPPGREGEPAVYEAVRSLPAEAVLLELPVGAIPWDTYAMFRSTRHWRALVNGYSGHFADGFIDVRAAFRRPLADPERTWQVLRRSGATHVLVHEQAWYREGVSRRIVGEMERRGALRVFDAGGNVLLGLPPSPRNPNP